MSTQNAQPIDLDRRVAEIMALDLTSVREKLMDPEEGKGWSPEVAERAERWYRWFLILNLKYPEKRVVPVANMDDFWHQHILDTRTYTDDCSRIFGYFLHHYPYLGMRGDKEVLEAAFDESVKLFEKEFGEESSELALEASKCSRCSRCRNCSGSH